MELSQNQYKKFLVDEVLRASKATTSNAYKEVMIFSKTKEFESSYKKWVSLNKKEFRCKSMKEVIYGMDL